jgi:hypothetical protein
MSKRRMGSAYMDPDILNILIDRVSSSDGFIPVHIG